MALINTKTDPPLSIKNKGKAAYLHKQKEQLGWYEERLTDPNITAKLKKDYQDKIRSIKKELQSYNDPLSDRNNPSNFLPPGYQSGAVALRRSQNPDAPLSENDKLYVAKENYDKARLDRQQKASSLLGPLAPATEAKGVRNYKVPLALDPNAPAYEDPNAIEETNKETPQVDLLEERILETEREALYSKTYQEDESKRKAAQDVNTDPAVTPTDGTASDAFTPVTSSVSSTETAPVVPEKSDDGSYEETPSIDDSLKKLTLLSTLFELPALFQKRQEVQPLPTPKLAQMQWNPQAKVVMDLARQQADRGFTSASNLLRRHGRADMIQGADRDAVMGDIAGKATLQDMQQAQQIQGANIQTANQETLISQDELNRAREYQAKYDEAYGKSKAIASKNILNTLYDYGNAKMAMAASENPGLFFNKGEKWVPNKPKKDEEDLPDTLGDYVGGLINSMSIKRGYKGSPSVNVRTL